MAASSDRLYVTYVDAYNGLLKIWGQPNRTCATYVEKQLLQLIPEFQRLAGPSPSSIRQGTICIAKYEDESYYRGKIISDVVNNSVLVFFIDYGNKDRVDLSNIVVLGSPAENIIMTIAAQAEEYYLANIRAEGGWSPEIMSEIRRGLCYSEHKFRMVCQTPNEKLIQISYRNEDYSSFLIRQDLAKPVSVKEQMFLLRGSLNLEQMGSTFKAPSVQHIPQQSSRDNFFMQNKVTLGQTAQERLNLPIPVNSQSMHSQSLFTQSPGRSGTINNDRHFNIVNPSQKTFNQSSNNAAYSENKSTPVLNTVVIEALANQLKQHLLKDQPTPASGALPVQGYATQVLDVKTTHNVYISYIDDGPWSFSVQLVSNEHELNQLMDELAAYNFQPIKLPLVLGSPCIAKSKQYENYCRGVLVNITHSAVKVFFVDFGNTEDLPSNMLFEMPAKFLHVKTMSQKFALSGLQKVRPTEEIKQAFIEVVENELLILHVINLEGENLPTCDLYLKDINIKRILNDKLRVAKTWDPVQFPHVGEIETVLVTWVESPQKFYVQLKRQEPELKNLKTELAKYGESGEHFEPEDITPGTICICFFTGDKNWYRAVVTSVESVKAVTVFYIDYGNTEVVDSSMMKKVGRGVIANIRTQAIQCCLSGYESELPITSTKEALKELIFEKEFNMKVLSNEKDYINVQLFDCGKDVTQSLKQLLLKFNEKDTSDWCENLSVDSDLASKRNIGKSKYHFGTKNGSDKMDSGKSRGKREVKNEKAKIDLLSWRLEDNRKDPEKKVPKLADKSTKTWEFRDISSDGRSDKYDSSRNGRNSFKTKKSDSTKSSETWEKNWRETDSFETKAFTFGDSKFKTKLGESISERMKRAARENEERGLKMEETLITRLPVKLENIAYSGFQFKMKEIEIGSTEEVIVTYFSNPNEIYVQLLSDRDNFRRFMADIHNYYSTKLPMPSNPKKGDVVIAKYQQDGVLYRATVLAADPITIRYADFGNEEISERENLWPMDKKFLDLESQCVKCTLSSLKPCKSDTWPIPSDEMDKIFEYDTYECTFLKKLDDGYEVKLTISETGADVRNELIRGGFAEAIENTEISYESPSSPDTELHIGTTMAFDLMPCEIFNVFISHIVSPTEFYVQLRRNAVEAIDERIRKYVVQETLDSTNGSNNISSEHLYLVKIESGKWHRARVIEKKLTHAVVQLIDYGNQLSINYEQIKPIPDDLAKESPQAVACSLFLDYLTDGVFEKFTACVKNNYAAFIHEAVDQRLRVTLYSLAGEKLDFLECNNDVPTWIRPIAYLPIIEHQMLVTMPHIKSPKEIYVQLLDDAKKIEEFTSSLNKYYSRQDNFQIQEELSEYELYAVKSISDRYWYRAELLSHNGKSAKMFYIDFGVTEEVPKQNLRKLDSSFYRKHAFAKKVSLNIDYGNDKEMLVNNQLRHLIGGKVCNAHFAKVNDILYADFEVDDILVTPQLVSDSVKELVVGLFDDRNQKKSEESPKGSKVFVTCACNTEEFWVQEESKSNELRVFRNKLHSACVNGTPVEKIAGGDVIGIMLKDKAWYRARVLAVCEDSIIVRTIDYGNTLKICREDNKFIALNEELKTQPSFARMYALKGEWRYNSDSRFVELIAQGKEGTVTLIRTDKENEADLLLNGESIADKLAEEGYEQKLNNQTVFITHINSPDDFFIQKESDQETFERVMSQLKNAELLPDAEDVKVNEIYCAKYQLDTLWYRARVLTQDKGDIVVSFIDYGNFSIVERVKELPLELKSLPPLAQNCCLERTKGFWLDGACKYFWKYIYDVPLRVEVLEQCWRTKTVRLFTQSGENVGDALYKVNFAAIKAPNSELIDDDTQDSLLSQENAGSANRTDSCPSETGESSSISDGNTLNSSNLTDDTPKAPKRSTGKTVSESGTGREKSYKFKKTLRNRRPSKTVKVAPDSAAKEVSARNAVTEEKVTPSSSSAPVKPAMASGNKQLANQKSERENKSLPGYRDSALSAAQGENASDEKKQAAEKLN